MILYQDTQRGLAASTNVNNCSDFRLSAERADTPLVDMDKEDRSGPFEKEHTDEEILACVDQEEVVTTKEVSDQFDYHLQIARRRLKALAEEGELNQKDVGKRFVRWISNR